MREVLDELMQWWEAGETIGVGTVVATFRSAPRPPGASMLVGPDKSAVGSVSGGCVEGAVYELAESVVASGAPVLQRYGVSDDDAFAVGLTCGGILDVYVEEVSRRTFPELGEIAADLRAGRPVAVATVIEHPDPARLGTRMIVRPDADPQFQIFAVKDIPHPREQGQAQEVHGRRHRGLDQLHGTGQGVMRGHRRGAQRHQPGPIGEARPTPAHERRRQWCRALHIPCAHRHTARQASHGRC